MSGLAALPHLGSGPPFEPALLARAFQLLLDEARPVDPARLAQELGCDRDRVEQTLVVLDSQGRVRRDQTGAVTGSHGLSLTPTPHELLLERPAGQARRYWTWCAWDALGILAALNASGRIRSTGPGSVGPIQLEFDHGHPRNADPELVVFFADTDCYTPAGDGSGGPSVVDDWCPLVNFFEHAGAAKTWAADHGVHGSTAPLTEATERGRAAWRQWTALPPKPTS